MLEMPSMLKTLLLMSVVLLPEGGCGGCWEADEDPTGPSTGPVATYVVVTPQSATIKIGETVSFSAEIQDQFTLPMQGSVQWSSANFSVATVSSTGTAIGSGPGITAIIATHAGITDVAQLTVVGIGGD